MNDLLSRVAATDTTRIADWTRRAKQAIADYKATPAKRVAARERLLAASLRLAELDDAGPTLDAVNDAADEGRVADIDATAALARARVLVDGWRLVEQQESKIVDAARTKAKDRRTATAALKQAARHATLWAEAVQYLELAQQVIAHMRTQNDAAAAFAALRTRQ